MWVGKKYFIVWELVVKIPNMIDNDSPFNIGGGLYDISSIKQGERERLMMVSLPY